MSLFPTSTIFQAPFSDYTERWQACYPTQPVPVSRSCQLAHSGHPESRAGQWYPEFLTPSRKA